MSNEQIFKTTIGDLEVSIATGKLAQQAGGAVTVQFGDTVLLATATMSRSVREGLDFFPLSVDFEEKMYAAGRIPGSFFRREGRASTESVLIARMTDRPLRPLFPDGMRNEVQIIVTTLSYDGENQMDVMAINAASAALMVSDIPWDGPIGAVRVGYINGEFVANPTVSDMENSTLNLRLAGTKEAIIMVEAGADEVDETLMVDALAYGHEQIQGIVQLQEEMRTAVGKEKAEIELNLPDEEVAELVKGKVGGRVAEIVAETTDRHELREKMRALREELTETLLAEAAEAEQEDINLKEVGNALDNILKKTVRARILHDKVRPDGRDFTTIRELSSEIGLSPRAHGSGLFSRGETQVMSLVALGTPREALKLDGLEPEESQRYMHHYNFPPFSTGETWFLRGPKRREIGHGELAGNALRPVIPPEDEFPYTIRVVSEVLSSNGSTSQASVCASTLALMDCGVPIRRPVAGIAMGLISDFDGETNPYAILTDIQGMEDHLGDMDFKVAGTAEGITALQMDIKITGLSREVMAEALEQARVARLQILDNMLATIAEPRAELNKWAPRMVTVHINPEKIGAVIGKGGSTIRSLEEVYEVSIDIQEDGTVFVAGVDGIKTDGAIKQIELLTKDIEAGETYLGKVVRVTDFGAFVELVPGTDGMVHISQLASERVSSVEDVVQLGDEVMVMVTAVSPDGKIRLSRQAVLEGWTLEEAQAADGGGRSSGGGRGGDRGGRGGGRGGDRGGRGGGGRGGNRGRN
ncbi:MAG: polyribonucleotide nucleotidyltransferase [Anaerolineales bacterium]|nr:polyribonucleotide nucleotidyltransferase [Anaerolineales bacterium]